jgi:hypothetical protein
MRTSCSFLSTWRLLVFMASLSPHLVMATDTSINSIFLEQQGVRICAATPINKHTAITAGHCISDISIPQDYVLKSPFEKYVIKKVEKRANDLAFLEVEEQFHAFIPPGLPNFENAFDTFLPSESTNKKTGNLKKLNSLFASHDLKTKFGDSGSPIIQNNKIVGVHVGRGEGSYAGVVAILGDSKYQGFDTAYSKEAPPLIAAATAYCAANQALCIALIGAGGVVLQSSIQGIFNYLVSINDADKAIIKHSLDQCTAEKESISRQLIQESNRQKANGQTTGSFESRTPSANSNAIPDDVTVVDLRFPPSGSTRCQWDGPSLRCVYAPESLDNSAREFLFLTRLAFLHRFYTSEGRWPSAVEAARVNGQLLSLSLDAAVGKAMNRTGGSVHPPKCWGPGCMEP